MCPGVDVELSRPPAGRRRRTADPATRSGTGVTQKPDHGSLMPDTDINTHWRTDRPAEGFYTTLLPTHPGLPVRTFLPTDYQPRYPYPLVVLFHAHGGSEEQVGRLAPRMTRRNYIATSLRRPP